MLRHQIKKYPDSTVHTLSDSLGIYFFPLWRADLKISGFAVEFAECVWTEAVSGKQKVADSKISGYVWTGPLGSVKKSSTPKGTPTEFNFHRHTNMAIALLFLGQQYGCHDENTLKILYHFGTVCFICYFHSELSKTSRVRAHYFRESLPR